MFFFLHNQTERLTFSLMMIWSKTEHHYSFSSNHVLTPRPVFARIRRVLPRFLFRVTVVANSSESSCRWNEQLCVGDVGMMISLFFVQTTCEAKMKRRRSLWEVVNWVETMLCVYVCCMWSSRGKCSVELLAASELFGSIIVTRRLPSSLIIDHGLQRP